MRDTTIPIEVGIPENERPRAERDALTRAEAYAAVDPFYEGIPLSEREKALMHLALRAMTEPDRTDIATASLIFQRDARTCEGMGG